MPLLDDDPAAAGEALQQPDEHVRRLHQVRQEVPEGGTRGGVISRGPTGWLSEMTLKVRWNFKEQKEKEHRSKSFELETIRKRVWPIKLVSAAKHSHCTRQKHRIP